MGVGARTRLKDARDDAARANAAVSEPVLIPRIRSMLDNVRSADAILEAMPGARRSISHPCGLIEKSIASGEASDATRTLISDLHIEAVMTAVALSKPRVRSDVSTQLLLLLDKISAESDEIGNIYDGKRRTGASRV